MKCIKCNSQKIIKKGIRNNKQRFYCSDCKSSFQSNYSYNAYHQNINPFLINLLREGCSVRGISRVLNISKDTVLSRMLKIAKGITMPDFPPAGASINDR